MKTASIFGCMLLTLMCNSENVRAKAQDPLAKAVENYGDDWERALLCYGLKKQQWIMIHIRDGSEAPSFHKAKSEANIYFSAAKLVTEQNSTLEDVLLDILKRLNEIHGLIMRQMRNLHGDARLAFVESQLVMQNCPVL